MKQLFFYLITLLPIITTTAQIKIGLPIGMADSSTVLDLGSKGGSFNKGVLFPQVNLSSNLVWGLLGTVVTDGMIVYNKAAAGAGATAVIPGLYIWAGGKWTLLAQANLATPTFSNCGSAVFSPAPAGGLLTNGTTYSSSYTLTYTAGSGLAYNTITQTISGLTLTRTAGTYSAGGGSVVYNVSGSYTGVTNTAISFTIVECNLSVVY